MAFLLWKNGGIIEMERTFIDREWCISYILLALNNIEDSANRERTVKEFIEEIRTMFDIYTDEAKIKQIEKEVLKRMGKKKIRIGIEEK